MVGSQWNCFAHLVGPILHNASPSKLLNHLLLFFNQETYYKEYFPLGFFNLIKIIGRTLDICGWGWGGGTMFHNIYKYRRVYVDHTRKIPVELVNPFFCPTNTQPLLQQQQITSKEMSNIQIQLLNSVVSCTLHINRCCDLHIK